MSGRARDFDRNWQFGGVRDSYSNEEREGGFHQQDGKKGSDEGLVQ